VCLLSLSVPLNNHHTAKFSTIKPAKEGSRTSAVALSLKLIYSGYRVPGKGCAVLIENVAMVNPPFFEEMLNL
jgi:hypothetical protein